MFNKYKKAYALLLMLLLMLSTSLFGVERIAPEVGDVQSFWAYSNGFFSGYYNVTATCQEITDNAYLFTENAKITDIAFDPEIASTLLVATSSGLYASYDFGDNWVPASGAGPDVSSKVLDHDFDSGGQNVSHKHVTALASAFILRNNEWWVGQDGGSLRKTFQVAVSKDQGETWVQKTRGLPVFSFIDANGAEQKRQPRVNSFLHPFGTSDYINNKMFYMSTEAGLFYWLGTKFINLSTGLPKAVGEWDNVNISNVVFTNDSTIYAATDLGLFYGTVNLIDENIIWKAGGVGTCSIDLSKNISIDTVNYGIQLNLNPFNSNNDAIVERSKVIVKDDNNNVYWNSKVIKDSTGIFYIVLAEVDEFYNLDTIDYENNISDYTIMIVDSEPLNKIALVGTEIFGVRGKGLVKFNENDLQAKDSVYYSFESEINDILFDGSYVYVSLNDGMY
ncbi:MAG: hypothetical protein KAI81_05480, partial [Candidatus Marinimicrobia bacterium]|nr:hypothetical protein [Candidatus Neomarinimicrobiota bacterium]